MSPAPHPLEPDEHRRARHLFVLKSLTDRGHRLALKAADHAEAQLDSPDAGPEPERHHPAPRAPDYNTLFERYARLVRLLVTAEDRTAQTRRAYRPAGPNPDPRRPQLHQFIQQITRNSPDRAATRREALVSLDEALDRDQALTLPAGAVLCEICDLYGVPFDITKLPDEFLVPPITGPPQPHMPR